MKQSVRRYLGRYPILIDVLKKAYYIITYLMYWPKSKIIAGPGFLNYKGGIFNPGAVSIDNGETLLLAKGQVRHWKDAVSDKNNFKYYLQGAPVVTTLNDNLQVKSSYAIHLLHNYPAQDDLAIEDFRIFSFESKIWVNHVLIQIERDSTQIGYRECTQALSILDPVKMSLTLLGNPKLDFIPNRKEKNWVYVEHNGDLYLFYSFYPYHVLKLVDASTLTFKTVVDQCFDSRLEDIGGFGTLVSFSANPIGYDNQHWLLVVHQIDTSNKKRLYYHWGVLVEKGSFTPMKITSAPLFSGLGARGRLKGVRYVMSVINRNTDYIFFCGEGDDHLTRITISKAKLDKMWSAL